MALEEKGQGNEKLHGRESECWVSLRVEESSRKNCDFFMHLTFVGVDKELVVLTLLLLTRILFLPSSKLLRCMLGIFCIDLIRLLKWFGL